MKLVARRTHTPIRAAIDTISSDAEINPDNPSLHRDNGEQTINHTHGSNSTSRRQRGTPHGLRRSPLR